MKKELAKDIFKKGDIILVIILILAVILTAVFATQKEDSFVEVYVNGNFVCQLELDEDSTIDLKKLKCNVDLILQVKDGKVSVTHSDCPDKLCVSSSAVSSVGGMIVCLPNKVVIKVMPKEVDAIS